MFLWSSIFIIKKPPGINIGSLTSPICCFFILAFIFLFREFNFIHPKFPPFCDVSELLNIRAAFEKPFKFISDLIKLNLFFKVSFFFKLNTISANILSDNYFLKFHLYIFFINFYIF